MIATAPDKKSHGNAKPIDEHKEFRYSRSISTNGFITIPLRDVLAILDLKIKYTEDDLAFHNRSTGEHLFTHERGESARPWDILRERGYFAPEKFERPARIYLKSHPSKA